MSLKIVVDSIVTGCLLSMRSGFIVCLSGMNNLLGIELRNYWSDATEFCVELQVTRTPTGAPLCVCVSLAYSVFVSVSMFTCPYNVSLYLSLYLSVQELWEPQTSFKNSSTK
jgi:hypothetical protein